MSAKGPEPGIKVIYSQTVFPTSLSRSDPTTGNSAGRFEIFSCSV
jgi:hypothetical protein